jgi:predicted ester cyclase
MSIDENKAIVRRFFEHAWNQNKTSDLEEYISAERIHHFGAKPLKHSTDGLREMIKNWRGAMPDYHAHIENTIAEGDLVVVLLRFTGTQTGRFEIASRVLEPTNRKIDESEILIFRIAQGKIVESWATWDRLSVLEQLGAAPPRATPL